MQPTIHDRPCVSHDFLSRCLDANGIAWPISVRPLKNAKTAIADIDETAWSTSATPAALKPKSPKPPAPPDAGRSNARCGSSRPAPDPSAGIRRLRT